MRPSTSYAFGYLIVGMIRFIAEIFILWVRIIVAVLLFILRWIENRPANRKRVEDKIFTIIKPHIEVLAKKRLQLLTTDDYGVLHTDRWSKELGTFVGNVLVPSLGRDASYVMRKIKYFSNVIDASVHRQQEANREHDYFPTDGTEYEIYCAKILTRFGWSVIRKGASGDQGVDLLAVIGSAKVAIQCKCYSKPVGNKAVQETISGRQFYGTQYAAVVTNATYTTSAKDLARVANVFLLHHSELQNLALKISPVPCLSNEQTDQYSKPYEDTTEKPTAARTHFGLR
jgi:restriction system protein